MTSIAGRIPIRVSLASMVGITLLGLALFFLMTPGALPTVS